MMLLGISTCIIASIGFGSTFVPVRRYNMGDGFFVQLLLCFAAFCVSTVVLFIQGIPPIYPYAMFGGMIWCLGSIFFCHSTDRNINCNAFCIRLMNTLGMGLASLIWCTTSCLTGWATSRFGLFGLTESVPDNILLNYLGIVILVVGGVCFLFIKSSLQSDEFPDEKTEQYIYDIKKAEGKFNDTAIESSGPSVIARICAILGCICCGLFFGNMTLPITYMINNSAEGNWPTSSLDYVFSYFLGVMPTSAVLFACYAIAMKFRPVMDTRLIIPSLLSGVIFGVSMPFFLLSNELISQAISYPLCTTLPGLVVTSWSVLYFKEITGTKNLTILIFAYILTLTGVVFVALSR